MPNHNHFSGITFCNLGVAKEALSNALWTCTANPQVANNISKSWPFLQNIISSIQEGPNGDSESHTGILANCLPQRHVDPGLLKPMVPTLLQELILKIFLEMFEGAYLFWLILLTLLKKHANNAF